jgi:hypothetical protein
MPASVNEGTGHQRRGGSVRCAAATVMQSVSTTIPLSAPSFKLAGSVRIHALSSCPMPGAWEPTYTARMNEGGVAGRNKHCVYAQSAPASPHQNILQSINFNCKSAGTNFNLALLWTKRPHSQAADSAEAHRHVQAKPTIGQGAACYCRPERSDVNCMRLLPPPPS